MRDHWKLLTAIVVAVAASTLLGLRVKHAFAPQAPASLHYQQHTSPGLLLHRDLRLAAKNVETIITQTRQEERTAHTELVDILYLQVGTPPTETLVWDTVSIRNPGFEPLHRVERTENGKALRMVGYYSLDGRPLDYDTKIDLRNPRQTLTTVDLDQPVGAGQTALFFRVYRTTGQVTTNTLGRYIVHAGKLPATAGKLYIASVVVPTSARVEQTTPEGGLHADHQVTWFSSRLESGNHNCQLTFTIPK